ncbi:MAG: M50 family peptidase [Methyloprofundus sp.]|nr:M50 family peptidase [Methyloprofundus sp.]
MRILLSLTVLIILISAAWNSPVLLPLKWLVVFFHEASHAVATVLTGGVVQSLLIVPEQGGQVISSGGNRFIILSAGYLGSLLCGLLLFLFTVYMKKDQWLSAGLGVLLLIITVSFAKTLFSQLFGGLTGVSLCLVAYYLPAWVNDLICRVIALTSLLYVPMDIYDDTLARHHLRSDAAMLAEEFGGHTVIWGALWLIISILLIVLCLWLAVRLEVNQGQKHRR